MLTKKHAVPISAIISIIITLAFLHFFSAYPGGMVFDSFTQFKESVDKEYFDWHPPIMAYLWTLLNSIHTGPQLMLAKNIILLWLGVGVFYFTLRKYNPILSLTYLALPLIPGILLESSFILKDMDLAICLFLSAAIFSYFTLNQQKPPIAVSAIALLLIFYGSGVKFQGKFIVPIMVMWLMWLYYRSNKKLFFLTSFLITLLIIGGNMFFLKKFSQPSFAHNSRIFFDIAGISVNKNLNLFPEFIKNNPKFSFAKLKQFYTARHINSLREKDVYIAPQTQEEAFVFDLSFYYAVASFPRAYLRHRVNNYKQLLFDCKTIVRKYGEIENAPDFIKKDKYPLEYSEYPLKKLVRAYIEGAPKIFSQSTYLYFFIVVIQTIYLLPYLLRFLFSLSPLSSARKEAETIKELRAAAGAKSQLLFVLAIMNLVSIAYGLTLFLTMQSSCCRYYHIVKLFSAATIPIFLALLLKGRREVDR